MKKNLLLMFLCLFNSSLNSQLLCEWADYSEYANTYFTEVATDGSGCTYVSGYFGDQLHAGSDTIYSQNFNLVGHTIKYSTSGDRIWITSFSSSNSVLIFGMDADNIGNTTIYGTFKSNLTVGSITLTTPSSDNERGFVAQLNPAGNLNWIREIIPSSNSFNAKYLEVDDSGNVLFENRNTTTINGITNNGLYTLTKLDLDGNVLWRYDKDISTSGYFNDDLIAEFNGGYVIAGSLMDTTVIAGITIYPVIDTIVDQWNDTTFSFRPESVLIFLDMDGNEIGFRTIKGSLFHSIYNIYSTDSKLYVSGRVNGFLTNGSQDVYTTSEMNYLTAYDLTLNPLFMETSNPFEVRGLYANQNHVYTVGIKSANGYLEKFDTQGILEDTISIVSSNFDYITDITGYDDGNVVIVGISSASINICGFTMNPVSGHGAFIIKLNEEIVMNEELESEDQNILVFPNPTNTSVTLRNVSVGSTFQITDLTGKLVYKNRFKEEQFVLNTEEFPNGIYTIQIENKGTVTNKKLVVNK